MDLSFNSNEMHLIKYDTYDTQNMTLDYIY